MSARTIAKVILVAAGVAASIYLVYLLRDLIWLVLVAIFLAVALGPLVDFLQHRGVRRGLAILVAYLLLLAAVFVIGLAVVPPIVDQTNEFITHVPEYVDDIAQNETLQRYDERYGITQELQQQAAQLPTQLGSAAGALRDVTVGVFSALVQLISVLVIAFFLLLDGKRIVDWGLNEVGPERGRRFRAIADDVYRSVGGYVAGNLLISLIAGFTTWLVLTLLDIPFAVPLALLMALLDLVPLVGATIAGFVITTVCAIENFPEAPIIFFVYLLVYQQIENNVLQPMIYRRTVKLHPLIVLVGILAGAELLGVLGVLLAIPVAGAVQILVKDWWLYRKWPPGAEPVAAP
jgi:predicted PurR-regulated permease PerM